MAPADEPFGGYPDDRLYPVSGTEKDDTLQDGLYNDVLFGGLGNDTMSGEGGADELHVESGEDTLRGGAGDDILYIDRSSGWIKGEYTETGSLDGGADVDTAVLDLSSDGTIAETIRIANVTGPLNGDDVIFV